MEKQEFLHKLAKDTLSDEQIVQGFAKHYLCSGKSARDTCRDVCLAVSAAAARAAGEKLMRVFRILAGEEDDHGYIDTDTE